MEAWFIFNVIILCLAFLIGSLTPDSIYSRVPILERIAVGLIWAWVVFYYSLWAWAIYAAFHLITKYW